MCVNSRVMEKEDVEEIYAPVLSISYMWLFMSAVDRKDESMKTKRLNASMTIEMSIIVPLILFIIMGLILTVFYFHDKNILSGAASETAIVGSAKLRGSEEISEEELERFCRERIHGKSIFLVTHQIDVTVSDTEVMVEVTAAKKDFSISVVKRAVITEPEKWIRNIRRVDIKNGTKNYN